MFPRLAASSSSLPPHSTLFVLHLSMPQAALTFTSDTALDSFALDPATGVVTVTKALVTPVVTTLQVTATDSRPTCVVAVGPNAVETGEPCTSQPATLEVRLRLCVCVCV